MKAKIRLFVVSAILSLLLNSVRVQGQGTVFTYQGRLAQDGAAANGNYDLRFGLYTNVSIGNLTGNFQTNAATAVTNGVFTSALNFSNAFNGSAYWLEIAVRTNGSTNAFTPLTPRQPITPVPYAITASNLTGTLPATQLTGSLPANVVSGTFSNGVSFTNLANVFAGNGIGLTNVSSVTQSNYVYAYDNNSQAINSVGSYQNIGIGLAAGSGWLVPVTGQFVAPQTGVYLVQYQAHFANGSASFNMSACIRAMLNITTSPVEITGSEGVVYVPPSCIEPLSRTFMVSMTAGQIISLQMTGNIANGTSGGYLVSTTFFGQFFPSVSLTIVRIQ